MRAQRQWKRRSAENWLEACRGWALVLGAQVGGRFAKGCMARFPASAEQEHTPTPPNKHLLGLSSKSLTVGKTTMWTKFKLGMKGNGLLTADAVEGGECSP